MDIREEMLIEVAGLAALKDDKELMMVMRRRLNSLDAEYPDLARKISRRISQQGGRGALRRFYDLDNVPVDADSGMELLVADMSPHVDVELVLPPEVQELLDRFVKERSLADDLNRAGIVPPTSLALMGSPGTGKTSLSRWLAEQLGLPLYVLNLASVITSYLGQTGQNIKKALDRAKLEPSVLLLDEFDALGRLRTDDADVGEMKRVVTVLLQEIENWPQSNVIVAATNLPELIDHAFKRRFSRWISLPLPKMKQRKKILNLYYKTGRLPKSHLDLAAICLVGASGADLASFVSKIKTREIVDQLSPSEALYGELMLELADRNVSDEVKREFVVAARSVNKKFYTYRRLGKLFGISHTKAANLDE